ncbi:MAG: ATP-binding cassette domain-containing protein [Pseudomonadota bacterium]
MVNPKRTIVANDASVVSDRKVILENVTLECCPGEWTLLTGPSGAGKSTLLNMLNGLCSPSSGSVTTLGTRRPGATRLQNIKVWGQCGTVLQDVALFDCLNVLDNVTLPLKQHSLSKMDREKKASYWLERLGMNGLEHEYPCRLSGGQRQRVALARAFVVEPKVLFLYDPYSALDDDNAAKVVDILAEFASAGTSIMMSTHQPALIQGRCDTMLEVNDGCVCEIA